MSKDIAGKPFNYPNTFLLLWYVKIYFQFSYRQTEGIAPGHAKWKLPYIPNYTTISIRRINKLDIKIEKDNISKEYEDKYITIVKDITGIKVAN